MIDHPIPPNFGASAAMKAIAAYRAGLYAKAAAHIDGAFVWGATGMGHDYWERVCDNLQSANPHKEDQAILVLQHWVNKSHGVVTPRAEPAPPPPLTDDQVASWLALKGMVMIDREELAALRRNGASGPPPIPADVYRRISRY